MGSMTYKSNRILLQISIVVLFALASYAQHPTKGFLVVHSTPGGAQVYVDDQPMGTTSSEGKLRLPLKRGPHTVRLTLLGYVDWEGTTTLTAGRSVTVEAALIAAQSIAKNASPLPSPTPETSPSPQMPTLDETAQWIVNNLVKGGGSWSQGHPVTEDNIRAKISGCILTYTVDHTETVSWGVFADTFSTDIPLGSLDDVIVTQFNGNSFAGVGVTASTDSITTTILSSTKSGKEQPDRINKIFKRQAFHFAFAQSGQDNADLMPRMVKALTHARDLCKVSYHPHSSEPF
jgi:hypothetical protein